jgi:cation-transporting ATPase 13A1
MILSIVINNSIVTLIQKKIYCTESHRIPIGGKTSMVAFDKTGTLTSDQLTLEGVITDCRKPVLKGLKELSQAAEYVLAGCHNLIHINRKYEGDPL